MNVAASIESVIAAAGSRADSLGGFARELFLHLEARAQAAEARIAALESFANPVARVGQAAVAAVLEPANKKLKDAARVAAQALETALAADDAPGNGGATGSTGATGATGSTGATGAEPPAEPAEPAAHT